MFTKRNVFDLTHEKKLSMDMGKLIPIMCEEVLPGDTWKVKTDVMIRFSPLLAPVMHRINVYTHYFFVPNRLIWTDWENFITGGEAGTDTTIAPTMSFLGTITDGTLMDYFGLPTTNQTIVASALPFRAYNLIWNDWFRAEYIQSKVAIDKGNGTDTTTATSILTRNWEKDYFTSALPWPQRGAAVTLPLGTTADVTIDNTADQLKIGVGGATYTQAETDANDFLVATGADTGEDARVKGDANGNLIGTADLSTATAATINALRAAFQVQKWMERNARAGVRYIEAILAHFGVRSSDARLQRPEYLGGGKSHVVVSEVLQTAPTVAGQTPLATMAGHGYSALRSHGFKKSFEEHGLIIGLMSILPRTAYQQGLPRQWSRATRYDYYWPEFANLGEQAILNKELYVGGDGNNDVIFGYQGRYDEYRRRESTVHGDFRTSLNFWHMGRYFDSRPTLSSGFIAADPTERIFAVPSGHNIWVQLLNQVKAIRPLPKVGEPGLIDHN